MSVYLALAPFVTSSDLSPMTPLFAQTLPVAVLERRAQVPGARLAMPGEVPVPLRLRVFKRGTNAPVATLDQCKGPKWQDTLSEAGSASVIFGNDDPDLNLIDEQAIILFELHGYAAFTMLPRLLERATVPASEEAGALTTVSGAGHLAMLEEAVVYPSRGIGTWPIEDDRLFSWPAPDYDDSWWSTAWALAKWSDPTVWTVDAKPGSAPAPDEWPDPNCEWIWAPGSTWMLAPGGPCYARTTFLVPDGVTAVRIYFAFDATGTLYLDGQEVGTNEWALDTWKASQEEMPVTPGWHTIACQCSNDILSPDDANQTQNPGGLLVAVYASGPAGNTGPILRTSDQWRFLAYPPEPPGMTPGEAMLHCIAEAQARGAIAALQCAFDRYTDSAGRPWPVVGDIATKVGYDLLTFFRELAGTYIDIAMAPGCFELYAWALGGRGEYTGVNLTSPTDTADPTTGNLLQLNHKRVL